MLVVWIVFSWLIFEFTFEFEFLVKKFKAWNSYSPFKFCNLNNSSDLEWIRIAVLNLKECTKIFFSVFCIFLWCLCSKCAYSIAISYLTLQDYAVATFSEKNLFSQPFYNIVSIHNYYLFSPTILCHLSDSLNVLLIRKGSLSEQATNISLIL